MAEQTLEQIRKVRLEKVEKLREMGINPYPSKVKGNPIKISDAKEKMDQEVEVAGRIMGWRGHGNVVFADLKDESGQIQLWFQKNNLGDNFRTLKLFDVGDFLYAKGKVTKTAAGETSIDVADFQILTKSIRPLPSKWHGLKDVEERYRKRYLDMIMNNEVKKLIDTRWLIEKEIRQFLWGEGYTEVETPILQELYGGTNAKPFKTHMNALGSDFYLRIAPELYLKRLVVGGYERVFEIARNFRNEGIDATHQPEFTMIEWYEAYGDYNTIMDTTEKLTRLLIEKIHGGTKLTVNGKDVDVGKKWPRIPMVDAIKTHLGIEVEKMFDEEMKKYLRENKIELVGSFSKGKAIFSIFEHLVTGKLIEPTWIIDYPIEVCPLQKAHSEKTGYAERFEGYIGGIEYADGWTEITDPMDQRERFEIEQKNLRAGDEEAHPLDENFIESLEYGMPPLGGIGIGIDRLVMFLTDNWQIKNVIAFPTLRPERKELKKSKSKNIAKGEVMDLGIDYESAKKLLDKHIKDEVTKFHCLESEAIMRTLAKHFDEDEEAWGIIGLLHDIDWEITKDKTEKHCIEAVEILKNAGASEFLIETIQSHGYGQGWDDRFYGPSEFKDKKRTSRVQHALAAAETLTGLIVASALIQPSKKLKDVKLSSLKKKFKNKKFAANCSREIMKECEEIGLTIDEFLEIGLKAIQEIGDDIGL